MEYDIIKAQDRNDMVKMLDGAAKLGWRLVAVSCERQYGFGGAVTHYAYTQRELHGRQ